METARTSLFDILEWIGGVVNSIWSTSRPILLDSTADSFVPATTTGAMAALFWGR
jgi:hypothetical protein